MKLKLELENPLTHYVTSLSRQGYSITRESLSKSELEQIYKLLTVKPNTNTKYAEASPSFYLFSLSPKKIYVPRYWGIKHFGDPKTYRLSSGDDITLDFEGSLRPSQETVSSTYLNKFQEVGGGGGVITLQCGGGKTVTALYLISQLKKKTLVVVHKSFLMDQWLERIQQYLPDAKVGFIQGKTFDIYKKDIVIGMLQSISMKDDYSSETFNQFGFVIYDECHHVGAEVFSKSLAKTSCPYTLGLSATPTRKDGLTKVFIYHLGDFVYRSKKIADEGVDVNIYYYQNDDPSYCTEHTSYNNQLLVARMINSICYCRKRNEFIISLLPKLIEEKRHILIISERKEQIKYLKKRIDELNIASCGLYVGGMKQADLTESATKDIMIGTYNMISEGFDCKRLNTLILASPRTDVEQTVGRILRLTPEQRHIKPLVIDVGDYFSIYKSQLDKRIRYYEKEGYNLSGYYVDDGLIKMKIVKLDRYFNYTTPDGQPSIIKLRRLPKGQIKSEKLSGFSLMD